MGGTIETNVPMNKDEQGAVSWLRASYQPDEGALTAKSWHTDSRGCAAACRVGSFGTGLPEVVVGTVVRVRPVPSRTFM